MEDSCRDSWVLATALARWRCSPPVSSKGAILEIDTTDQALMHTANNMMNEGVRIGMEHAISITSYVPWGLWDRNPLTLVDATKWGTNRGTTVETRMREDALRNLAIRENDELGTTSCRRSLAEHLDFSASARTSVGCTLENGVDSFSVTLASHIAPPGVLDCLWETRAWYRRALVVDHYHLLNDIKKPPCISLHYQLDKSLATIISTKAGNLVLNVLLDLSPLNLFHHPDRGLIRESVSLLR